MRRSCVDESGAGHRIVQELALRGSLELHINVDEDDTATRRFYEHHGFANNFPGSDWRMLLYYQELPPTR